MNIVEHLAAKEPNIEVDENQTELKKKKKCEWLKHIYKLMLMSFCISYTDSIAVLKLKICAAGRCHPASSASRLMLKSA